MTGGFEEALSWRQITTIMATVIIMAAYTTLMAHRAQRDRTEVHRAMRTRLKQTWPATLFVA